MKGLKKCELHTGRRTDKVIHRGTQLLKKCHLRKKQTKLF